MNTLNVRTSNNANLNAVFALLDGFLHTEVSRGNSWFGAIEEANARGVIVDIDETPLGRFLNSEVSHGITWGGAIEQAIEAGADVSFPSEAYAKFLAREEQAFLSVEQSNPDCGVVIDLPGFITGVTPAEVEGDDYPGIMLKDWLRDQRVKRILSRSNHRSTSLTNRRPVTLH